MLFLYALLYFALSNVIVAAPVGSNLDPPTESSNSKPSTPGSVANRRPISAVLLTRPVAPPPYDPYNNAVYNPHNRLTIKQLELEKGSIYFIQVPVSKQLENEIVPFVYIGPVQKRPWFAFVSVLSVSGERLWEPGEYGKCSGWFGDKIQHLTQASEIRTLGPQVAIAERLMRDERFKGMKLNKAKVDEIAKGMDDVYKQHRLAKYMDPLEQSKDSVAVKIF